MYDPVKPYKEDLVKLVTSTWKTPHGAMRDGLFERNFLHPEYHHIDGMGTKGVYHWKERSFHNAVLDALAMNLNDLAVARAIPYALIDHLVVPDEGHDAALEIIGFLADECRRRHIAITGGETAHHNNIEGLEISITMLGFVENPRPNLLRIGDVLIGIASSGLHSNGFTKVREVFGAEMRPEFTAATAIYLDEITALNRTCDIHAMAHITGGAFTKLKSMLPADADIHISRTHALVPHDIFAEMHRRGVPDEEMYKTFNCGIGFVLGVDEQDTAACLARLKPHRADIIGEVRPGTGRISIDSLFSSATPIL